jgi:hypothetical protein
MGSLVLAGATSGSTTITPTDAVTATVTLPSTGGTLQTSGAGFTTNGVAYATSTSALATGSALTFDGTNLGIGATSPSAKLHIGGNTASTQQVIFTTGVSDSDFKVIARNGVSGSTAVVGYIGLDYANGTWPTLAGIQFIRSSTSGELAFTSGTTTSATERMRLTSAGYLGIGTSSPAYKLQVSGAQNANDIVSTNTTTSASLRMQMIDGYGSIFTTASYPFTFGTNNTEGMRIDTSQNLLVGTTSALAYQGKLQVLAPATTTGINIQIGTNGYAGINFLNTSASQQGYIVVNASSVSYTSVSDYRLKNTIAPMTGALAKVALLKPVTYKWIADGSDAEGFIAHELAEVCPHAVSGTKDGVDEDGKPIYQGIDTSFLVATLTSAIQELSALVTAQSATITSLTERITALEGK